MWFITWLGCLGGYIDRRAWGAVVLFSVVHAIYFFVLLGYETSPFPVQVRIAYLLWVAIGTYIPGMTVLMWITTVGLSTNLFLDYCPLARMVSLLPWNRKEELTPDLLTRTFLTPPTTGKFKPSPNKPSKQAAAKST
jgi:hypothetical protein